MALVLQSPLQSRERILAFGGEGTGKSTAVLSIARKCPHVQFYYLQINDVTCDRLLDTSFQDVRAVGNVHAECCWDWEELLPRYEYVSQNMQRDDWIICDLGGDSWKMAQDWFAEQVHGVDMADYAVETRKRVQQANLAATTSKDVQKSLELLDGWMDWGVINPVYRKLVKAVLRTNGHTFWTAAADKYQQGQGDQQTDQLLGPLGFKPVGQKHIPFQFNTVLLMQKTKQMMAGTVGMQNVWTLTTGKDRGRPEVDRMQWGDFATDYLMRVAGWKLSAV